MTPSPATPRDNRSAARRGATAAAVAIASFLAAPLSPGPRAAGPGSAATVRGATVSIAVQSSAPDYLSPWQRLPAEDVGGSGVIIAGDRILTNAHVVLYAVSIEVKREGQSRWVPARVAYVCHACDLALLQVDAPGFFDGVTPVPLGPLPELQEEVQAYGYPVGGEAIAITTGVVSRIEVQMYSHSMDYLLLVQIDASLNPGNSGGPVIAGGELVGIATQSLEEAENIGYIIPTPIIRHFLADIEDGRLDGFPRVGFEYQNVENDALRRALRLPDDLTGALVGRVDYGSPYWDVLRTGDVILSVDGVAIAEDLLVPVPGSATRVEFTHLLRSHQMNDAVPIGIWRDGARRTERVTLTPWRELVPDFQYPEAPRYFMFGGLVFQPLTSEYINALDDPPANLLRYYQFDDIVTPERGEIVIVSNVLKHPVNQGYELAEGSIVTRVDDRPVRDFAQLVDLLDRAKGPLVKLRTEDEALIVLDVAAARAAAPAIMRSYGMAADRPRVPEEGGGSPQRVPGEAPGPDRPRSDRPTRDTGPS